jgi:hypothetical protein
MDDMQLEPFIKAIECGLGKIAKEDRGAKPEWTNAVKRCLLDVAGKYDLSSNCHVKSFPNKYPKNDNHEWLYDAVLYEATAQGIDEVWLTVESEWSTNLDDIFWDFSKLLIARSRVHLMVFDAPKGKYAELLCKLKEYINNSKLCKGSDEVYLFATYPAEKDEQFHFSTHKYGESIV